MQVVAYILSAHLPLSPPPSPPPPPPPPGMSSGPPGHHISDPAKVQAAQVRLGMSAGTSKRFVFRK
jgi:hypothetical protein